MLAAVKGTRYLNVDRRPVRISNVNILVDRMNPSNRVERGNLSLFTGTSLKFYYGSYRAYRKACIYTAVVLRHTASIKCKANKLSLEDESFRRARTLLLISAVSFPRTLQNAFV
jgi:hypothetical protein